MRTQRHSHQQAIVVLAALLAGCGRTELGAALGFRDVGAGGPASSGLGGIESSVGTGTFGTEGTTGISAGTVSNNGVTTGPGAGSTTAGGAHSVTGDSTSSGGGGSGAGAGGAAGAAACVEGSCDSSWSAPELIETDDRGSVLDPRVAMNRDGAAIVGWSQLDGARKHVWANRYSPGDGWAGAEWLEAHDEDEVNVRVAIDDMGAIIVVWQASGTPNLWSTRHQADAGWAPVEAISSNAHAYHDVAMGGGTAIVLWPDNSEPGTTLWSNAASASWGTPFAIRSGVTITDNRLAMNASGDAVAVWREWDDDRRALWSSRYRALGWTTPEPILPEDETGMDPDVALDPEGNAVVVWYRESASEAHVSANRFSPETGWGGPEIIDSASLAARYARVGMDDQGNAIAVWQQKDGAEYSVWANRYSVASGWGTPESIVARGAQPNRPELAVGAAGDAVAIWAQSHDTGYKLWSNRYTPDTGWGDAELVAPSMLDGFGVGDVAIDAHGNALLVWAHFADSTYSLWASSSSRTE
ncbi:MAG TPA: hypothetical protein VFU02_13750 [Polyangiaceae bacterium]|nr:hypothetical protein [Polyangiaceae bacterium]